MVDAIVSIDVIKTVPSEIEANAEDIIWITRNRELDSEWVEEVRSRLKNIEKELQKLP